MIEELHAQIEAVQRNLVRARAADLPYEAARHRARLDDLIEMAARYGVDVTTWVDPAVLAPPTRTDG